MKTHEIISNGKKYTFCVLKNTTKPCSECGVPACGKEDILWYEDQNQSIAIVFDGGYFDLACEEFFNKSIKTMEYEMFPSFLKEWNEARGWTDCWDYDGYVLQIEDFLRSMELLKNCEMGKWITIDDINDMAKMASNAKKIGAELRIVRG